MRLPSMSVLALVVGCGATSHPEPFIEAVVQPPTLEAEHVQQLVQARVPEGGLGADCRLSLRWEGPTTHGELEPLAPTEASERDAFWRIDTDVGAIDVVRTQGRLTCGAQSRDIGERWAGTSEADARYCQLCPERAPVPAAPARERDRPGIEVHARVGTSLEARESAIVDRCGDRTLLDLGGTAWSVNGATDRESEHAILLAADHGEDVCARPLVPGQIQIELPDAAMSDVAARLTAIPGLSVVLSLLPMPG